MITRRLVGLTLWSSALVAALGLLALDSSARFERIRSWSDDPLADLPPVAPDPASSSGYAFGQHRLVLPGIGTDGYHWILQTERSLAGEGPRVRSVEYDNHPQGREVHWAGPFRWWTLALVGAVGETLPELPAPRVLERVAPWAGTLLLACWLLGLTPWVAQRFGPPAAAVFAFSAVAVYPLYEYSVAGNFDHHGLAAICALTGVLLLASGGAGWVRPSSRGPAAAEGEASGSPRIPTRRGARGYFLASALVLAVGLSVSLVSLVPVLLGVGMGVALGSLLEAPDRVPSGNAVLDPGLWRLWGLTGGVASLVLYLLEYAPGELGMRLEVNHPLYALAWGAGGDLIGRLVTLRSEDDFSAGGEGETATRGPAAAPAGLLIGFDMMLVLLPAAVILLGGTSTFRLGDPLLWSLHRSSIAEFQGLGVHVGRMSSLEVAAGVSALPLLALPWAALLWTRGERAHKDLAGRGFALLALVVGMAFAHTVARGLSGSLPLALVLDALVLGALFLLPISAAPHVPPGGWRVVSLAAVPALILQALSLAQVRWLGLACGLWIVTLVIALPLTGRGARTRHQPFRPVVATLLVAALLPYPAFALWQVGQPGVVAADLAQGITRDVSHWLRARVGDGEAVVFADESVTTRMVYFGGFQGIGTLYWENLEGLRAAEAIRLAPTADQARVLLAERGVTHLVFFTWDGISEAPSNGGSVLAGTSRPPPAWLDAEAPPHWLVPLPFRLPAIGGLGGNEVRIFEVVPEQSAEAALVSRARYHRALGNDAEALVALRASLEARPTVAARSLLAQIQYVDGDREGFATTVALLADQPTLSGVDPELADQLDLAVAFALAGDGPRASRALEAALVAANERALRRLGPDQLSLLVELSRRLQPPGDHEGVLALAVGLLPESLRP